MSAEKKTTTTKGVGTSLIIMTRNGFDLYQNSHQGEFMLVKEREGKPATFVGGKVEQGDPSVRFGMKRETMEEAGIRLDDENFFFVGVSTDDKWENYLFLYLDLVEKEDSGEYFTLVRGDREGLQSQGNIAPHVDRVIKDLFVKFTFEFEIAFSKIGGRKPSFTNVGEDDLNYLTSVRGRAVVNKTKMVTVDCTTMKLKGGMVLRSASCRDGRNFLTLCCPEKNYKAVLEDAGWGQSILMLEEAKKNGMPVPGDFDKVGMSELIKEKEASAMIVSMSVGFMKEVPMPMVVVDGTSYLVTVTREGVNVGIQSLEGKESLSYSTLKMALNRVAATMRSKERLQFIKSWMNMCFKEETLARGVCRCVNPTLDFFCCVDVMKISTDAFCQEGHKGWMVALAFEKNGQKTCYVAFSPPKEGVHSLVKKLRKSEKGKMTIENHCKECAFVWRPIVLSDMRMMPSFIGHDVEICDPFNSTITSTSSVYDPEQSSPSRAHKWRDDMQKLMRGTSWSSLRRKTADESEGKVREDFETIPHERNENERMPTIATSHQRSGRRAQPVELSYLGTLHNKEE